jgi:HK97 family phage major capsid protein
LLTDTAGQFLGGGPFYGQYGNGGLASASNQVTGGVETFWGKPVVVTSVMGSQSASTVGTALIGTRANAQVWRRGGLNVEATNSHSNYFALNLVALRCEERLGLAIYRTGGYVEARLQMS